MARTIGSSGKIRIAIADDSGLTYSDDYRHGWKSGFSLIGCEVAVFDVSPLRRLMGHVRSPYRSVAVPGTAKAVAKQITDWSPDLVWCHHGRAASNQDFLAAIHRSASSAVYLCDEPYEVGETAKYSPHFKFVFTMDPCTLEAHRLSRPDRSNVYYLPPGVDVQMFKRVDYEERTIPALFLGNASLVPRPAWLKPIEGTVSGADIRFFKATGKRDARWVALKDHPALYAQAFVGLNVHRSPGITVECYKRRVLGRSVHDKVPTGLKLSTHMPKEDGTGFWNDANLPAAHVNPRFFEMAACGTLVVSDDHRSELRRMFPMAPRADSPERFLELVHYYLGNKNEAEAIGHACSTIISRRHSYAHRAAEVLIRAGLMESLPAVLRSSLGEPADWLTPQDLSLLKGKSSSDQTGRSERWSPQFGMSLTRVSGSLSDSTSLDVPTPWL